MYNLTKKGGPEWLTLIPTAGKQPAVAILVAPIDRKMKRKVARATRGLVPAIDPAIQMSDIPPEIWDQLEDAGEAATVATLREGILDWKGLAGADGKPLPFTPENLEAFIEDDVLFEAADRLYVKPAALRSAEGNGFAASLNGIGKAATPAIATASSRAVRKTAAAAKTARTPRTRSPRKRAKASGKS